MNRLDPAFAGFPEYESFLRELGARSKQQFLIGGQAVNFWAEYFDRKGAAPGLVSYRPFTSRDCDLWVDGGLWRHLRKTERGRLIAGASPADGQLGILILSEEPPRLVDLMPGVCGFHPEELPRLMTRALEFGGIRVIDPVSLFRCKCHCHDSLDQSGRQDVKHVELMALILPVYLSALIDILLDAPGSINAGDSAKLDAGKVLKEIKLVRKVTRMGVVKRVLNSLSINPLELIPRDKMRSCGIPQLRAYILGLERPGKGGS